MQTAVRLRRASGSSAEQEWLFDLYCELLRKHIEPAFGWDPNDQRRRFRREHAVECTSTVFFEEAKVGFVVATPRAESIHVSLLLLRSEWQRRGIGRIVMDRVFQEAATKALSVTLSCFRSNPRAIRFYQNLGFLMTGEDDHFVTFAKSVAMLRASALRSEL